MCFKDYMMTMMCVNLVLHLCHSLIIMQLRLFDDTDVTTDWHSAFSLNDVESDVVCYIAGYIITKIHVLLFSICKSIIRSIIFDTFSVRYAL